MRITWRHIISDVTRMKLRGTYWNRRFMGWNLDACVIFAQTWIRLYACKKAYAWVWKGMREWKGMRVYVLELFLANLSGASIIFWALFGLIRFLCSKLKGVFMDDWYFRNWRGVSVFERSFAKGSTPRKDNLGAQLFSTPWFTAPNNQVILPERWPQFWCGRELEKLQGRAHICWAKLVKTIESTTFAWSLGIYLVEIMILHIIERVIDLFIE